jgi:putative peptidoglycan lipid II flippase
VIAFILRAHLVRIVFGAGKFDWSATKLTAACFGIFMIGLFAQGLNYLIVKAFYSIHNTRIPALVSIFSVGTTALFAYIFVKLLNYSNVFSIFVASSLKIDGMQNLPVVGLPLAISLDVILQMIVLLILLRKKFGEFNLKEISSSLIKILGATFLTLFFTYFIRQISGGFTGGSTLIAILLQTALAGGLGFGFYLFCASYFGSEEVKSLKLFVLARLGLAGGKKS